MEVKGKKTHRTFRICQTRSRTEAEHRLSECPTLPSAQVDFWGAEIVLCWPLRFLLPPFELGCQFSAPSIWRGEEEQGSAQGFRGWCGYFSFQRTLWEMKGNLSNFLNLPPPRRQKWESHIFAIKMIAAICRAVWGHKHLPGRFSLSPSERKISPEQNPFPW